MEYKEKVYLLGEILAELDKFECEEDNRIFCTGYDVAIHQVKGMLSGMVNGLAADYADAMRRMGCPSSRRDLMEEVRSEARNARGMK